MGGDEEFLQGFPFGSGGGVGFSPHFSIKLNDLFACRGKLCPASSLASGDADNQGFVEALVHGVYHVPGTPVAKMPFPRRLRERSLPANRFQ